jgi:hypothetical protein
MSRLESLPDFLKPSLKMFLSVDLIGSTKLKHDEDALKPLGVSDNSLDRIGAKWFNYLIDFYSLFEEYFSTEWRSAFSQDGFAKESWKTEEAPALWKVNGDELIYVLNISHPGQIVVALHSWRRALHKYRVRLQKRQAALDVKATAWMAGFPIGNHEVAFWGDLSNSDLDEIDHSGKFGQYYRLNEWYKAKSASEKSDYVKDYIGPSVDTGFRLASFASSRKFPISIEIAYFLTKFPFDRDLESQMSLYYHGRESMKGVLSGVPYPVFWLDAASPEDSLTYAEDNLKPLPRKCDYKAVERYVSLFFDDARNKLFKPFIFGCSDNEYCQIPESYEAKLNTTVKIWDAEFKKHEIQNELEYSDGDIVENVTSEELSKLNLSH